MHPPADMALIHETIGRLQRLTDVFQERREQLAKQQGLTETEWRVLEEISTEHFMPSMFARRRESSAAAVSKIIRHLIDKDLIDVSISQNDGRQRDYILSARGRATMKGLRARRQRAIDAIWLGLDSDQMQQFSLFSAELVERIECYARNEE